MKANVNSGVEFSCLTLLTVTFHFSQTIHRRMIVQPVNPTPIKFMDSDNTINQSSTNFISL